MSEVIADFSQIVGTIKPMHAVNNGPVKARSDQTSGNFIEYAAARIPYARIHDAGGTYAYGGPHCVDVNNIFPNPKADENDPASYDFTLTDIYLRTMIEAGTQVFYRLGSTIEHWVKKYNTRAPEDFEKWARICEHIVAHYNRGWADGFQWNIVYWEIWNEPDLDPDDSPNKRCWGGTEKQFFELYKIAALHLKKCFPEIKVGGPAIAGNFAWGERFLQYMSEAGVPMDFFSWHRYAVEPQQLVERCFYARQLLDKYGYTKTESILNEYNYVRGWGQEWVYSLEQMVGMKGAAFFAASMLACQNAPLDMLMYYDARVGCGMNGMFHTVTKKRLKGYYAPYAFADLYEMKNQVKVSSNDAQVYAVAAKGDNGKAAIMICYYSDDDNGGIRSITIKGLGSGELDCRMVDEDNTYSPAFPISRTDEEVTFVFQHNSFMLITLR